VGPKLIPENASTSHSFECPTDIQKKEAGGITFAATDLGTFHILINGKLQGKDITNPTTNEKTTKVWNSDNYCAIFAIPHYDYSADTGNETISDSNQLKVTDFFVDFEFTYMVCHEENKASAEDSSPRISNQPPAPPQVSVSKCCPAQQSLDMSNPKHPVCIEDRNASSPFIAMRGLNMDDNFIDKTEEVEIQLRQDQENPHAMPPCFSDFEVHRIEHSGETHQNLI
jgi:hypothetical protein